MDVKESRPPKFGVGGKIKELPKEKKEGFSQPKNSSQSHTPHSKPGPGDHGYHKSPPSQSHAASDESGEKAKHDQPRESSGMITETFETPPIQDLTLDSNWTIWEMRDTKRSGSYTAGMEKVAWFGDVVTFWKVWNKIPHSNPKNFFSFNREGKSLANHYEIKGSYEKISTLALFKSGILPAWEDATNKKGGEYTTKVETSSEVTTQIWQTLVFDLATSNFPASERVCGIRIVDKGKTLKVELWVDYGLRKYCEHAGEQEQRLLDICKEAGSGHAKFDFQAHDG